MRAPNRQELSSRVSLHRPPTRCSSLAPPLRLHTDEMSPRSCPSSSYRGVRARPNGTFYAEIRSGDKRIGLGTFEMAHEAARAYDVVGWRLGRSRRSMNFNDVWTRQQAEVLMLPPAGTRELE
nr:ethylene-responsive transcription factor RAP2-6-like [Lolium perenne]